MNGFSSAIRFLPVSEKEQVRGSQERRERGGKQIRRGQEMFSLAHKLRLRAATIPPDCDYSPLLLRMGGSVRKTEKYVGNPGELGKPFKCSKENTNIYIYGPQRVEVWGRNIPTGALFSRSPHLLPSLLHFQASFPRSRSSQPPGGEAFPARGDPGNPEQPAAGRVPTLLPRLWGPAWSRSHSEQKASGGRRPARLALRPPLVRSGVPRARAAPAPLPAAGGYEWAQRKPRPTRT